MSTREKFPSIDNIEQSITGQVQDVRMLEDGSVQVKVLYNGQVIGSYVNNNPVRTVDLSEIEYRVIKPNSDSPSSIKVTGSYSSLIGSPTNRIVSTEKYGNLIVGPVVFTAHPESIRMGGVYRINGLHTSTMPSTIVTPISLFLLDIPGENFLKILKNILQEFTDFVKAI